MIGILLIIVLVIWIFFDLSYLLYAIPSTLYSIIKRMLWPMKLLDESIYYGFCFTNDMDFNWHMNNSKYLRNADYARFMHFAESGLYQMSKKLGARIFLVATNIRYRRSLEFLDVYRIHTKYLCWDEKAFYMEQRFERQKDNFVNAVAVVKVVVTGFTPQQLVNELQPGLSSPPPLPEVSKWIDSMALSSERLRKAS